MEALRKKAYKDRCVSVTDIRPGLVNTSNLPYSLFKQM